MVKVTTKSYELIEFKIIAKKNEEKFIKDYLKAMPVEVKFENEDNAPPIKMPVKKAPKKKHTKMSYYARQKQSKARFSAYDSEVTMRKIIMNAVMKNPDQVSFKEICDERDRISKVQPNGYDRPDSSIRSGISVLCREGILGNIGRSKYKLIKEPTQWEWKYPSHLSLT